MIRQWFAITFALAALGLAGCDNPAKSPLQSETDAGLGSARLSLPKLPAGYLADSGQQALFELTVSGAGMDPIIRYWSLFPGAAQPVLVPEIPAGVRSFQGRLIRIDPMAGDTTVTHEGADSAWIERGKETVVRLYLRAGPSGNAHICVEVEGWPADPSCVPPPPPPVPKVEGCYSLIITKSGPGIDTLLTASLRIFQRDTLLTGIVKWGQGGADTADGLLRPDRALYLGWPNRGDFLFKALIDSAGTLVGQYYDSTRNIANPARATRTLCSVIGPPPVTLPVDTLFVQDYIPAPSTGILY